MYPMGTAYKVGGGISIMAKATTVNTENELVVIATTQIKQGRRIILCLSVLNNLAIYKIGINRDKSRFMAKPTGINPNIMIDFMKKSIVEYSSQNNSIHLTNYFDNWLNELSNENYFGDKKPSIAERLGKSKSLKSQVKAICDKLGIPLDTFAPNEYEEVISEYSKRK